MPPAPPIDALPFLSARKRAQALAAPPELRPVLAWLLLARRQTTFAPRASACRKCALRAWPCLDPLQPGKQRSCEGCYRSGTRCVMPHPREAAAAPATPVPPARSILRVLGGGGDDSDDSGGGGDDAMAVDDAEDVDELHDEPDDQHAVPADAEAEQFLMAGNALRSESDSDSDSDSEIEFVSMTGPGPAHWIPPSRPAAPQATSSTPRKTTTTQATATIASTTSAARPTAQPTPPPTPPPRPTEAHQLHDLRWTDADVEAILSAAGRHADPSSVLLYNGEVKSLRGKTLLVVVVPAQDGMPWHVGLCERTEKRARLVCTADSGSGTSAMTDHVVALFRAMGCRIDDFGVTALGPQRRVPGAVWASVVAVWLTRKGQRPLPKLKQMQIREEDVLRDMNCLLRVGYWQGQCTAFPPAPQQTAPVEAGQASQVQAVSLPRSRAKIEPASQPNAPRHTIFTESPTKSEAKPPADSAGDATDSDASDSERQPAGSTSYYGVDFSEEGVGRLLAAAAGTAAAKSLVIYSDEKKFLQGAEQVILVFPPRAGLPWHIGVCHRPSQRTRVVCVEPSTGDTDAMLANVKERLLDFPSLRCDLSDLAAVPLPRKLAKLPGGAWAAIIAVWLSRGNSPDTLGESTRIRKKLIRKDLNLVLAGKQWNDSCVRTGARKKGRRTLALERAKDAVREEAEGDRPLTRHQRRRDIAREEERQLSQTPSTHGVFRPAGAQCEVIHL